MSIFQSSLPPPDFSLSPVELPKTLNADDDVLAYRVGPIEAAHVEAFRRATGTASPGMPPTFATFFRWGEFQWIERLGVDLARLLHTDQEYEIPNPLRVGDRVTIETRLKQDRERRGMRFLTLESRVLDDSGALRLLARTSFLIRSGETP